jgi:HPt (histidine-containing phosphotransfer) domain-containing protein
MGDEASYRGMLEEFLSSGPAYVDALRAARNQADWAAVERSAHTLKSMAQMVGATQLALACRELEHAAASGQAAPDVQAAWRQAEQAVRACLA